MHFSEWFRFDELKKIKPAAIKHVDIDRWLKSVDGLARDLQDLKKAKEKSQVKLAQVKKKFEPLLKANDTVQKNKDINKKIKIEKKDEKPTSENSPK